MKFSLKVSSLAQLASNCILVGMFENGELTPSAKEINKASKAYLEELFKQGNFQGKNGQILPLFNLAENKFKNILLIGCGTPNKLTGFGFRRLVISVMKTVVAFNFSQVVCCLDELNLPNKSREWKIKQIVEASFEACYRFDQFKSKKENPITLKEIIFLMPNENQKKRIEKVIKQAIAIAAGVNLTKDLANLPSNICTPTYLANQAEKLAKDYGSIKAKILSEKAMQKLNMGAILAVSQGSAEEAKLICLEYKGTKKRVSPVALIGKGITFDTGGNSIKPADNMVGMKYDMCGGR